MSHTKMIETILPVASFEKLSQVAYNKITESLWNDQRSKEPIELTDYSKYDEIKLPSRATDGSAGHDFYLTQDIDLDPSESIIVPTFIRCFIKKSWVLMIFPKSGLGCKYQMILANTVGIIDSDYYYTKSDDNCNEGHIMIKLVNQGDKHIHLNKGDKFCQGVFLQYGVSSTDSSYKKKNRNGGFGSTGN